MADQGAYLKSTEDIPEPHAFTARPRVSQEDHTVVSDEHGAADRYNNIRATIIHVMADAAVSVLVIVGLLLARAFGGLWMDPLAGTPASPCAGPDDDPSKLTCHKKKHVAI